MNWWRKPKSKTGNVYKKTPKAKEGRYKGRFWKFLKKTAWRKSKKKRKKNRQGIGKTRE